MAEEGGGARIKRRVSAGALLAVATGGGMLFALWKFAAHVPRFPAGVRLIGIGGACLLLVWGAKQSVLSITGRASRGSLNRHRVFLPREGMVHLTIMIVLFVGAMLGGSNMLLLVFAMMAGPFIMNGWITFTLLKWTDVRRSLPERAMAGETISVEIVLENRKRWLAAWLMAVKDHISDRRHELLAGVMFTRVPPRQERATTYQLRLMERGRYVLGPMELSTRFPLGLVERGRVFERSDEILIHPRIGRLTQEWQRESRQLADIVQCRATRAGVFEDEFHRIREYRPGDNPRAIHWRSSARRAELMVREYHPDRDHHLAVFLDLWTPASATPEALLRVERAVSFVATVCLDHFRRSRDARLQVVCSGEADTEWECETGFAVVDSLLDMLAVVQAGSAEGLGACVGRWRERCFSQTRMLLVTTRQQTSDEFSGLLESLAPSLEGGQPLQVIESDRATIESYCCFEDAARVRAR
ncbi:MAG: hypothetical protein CMJ48_01620 [Planctomycetaceae bacterium]|nr:hypothetical protein [Planctomycetaceae bacterium]